MHRCGLPRCNANRYPLWTCLLARFPTKPPPLFWLGLLRRCGFPGWFFFFFSRFLFFWLYPLRFDLLCLWFSWFLFPLLFLCRLLLDYLCHINPLDESHAGRVALAIAKLYNARVTAIAFR